MTIPNANTIINLFMITTVYYLFFSLTVEFIMMIALAWFKYESKQSIPRDSLCFTSSIICICFDRNDISLSIMIYTMIQLWRSRVSWQTGLSFIVVLSTDSNISFKQMNGITSLPSCVRFSEFEVAPSPLTLRSASSSRVRSFHIVPCEIDSLLKWSSWLHILPAVLQSPQLLPVGSVHMNCVMNVSIWTHHEFPAPEL
jgi:hypothetical protein